VLPDSGDETPVDFAYVGTVAIIALEPIKLALFMLRDPILEVDHEFVKS